MDHSLYWGQSPIDLAEEAPGEVKFLAALAEDARPDRDMGALERMAAWEDSGIHAGLGWAAKALVTSSLALLLLNTHALYNWAEQLPVTPLTEPVVNAISTWHQTAEDIGLNAVVDRVEQAAKAMRKAPWP
ncbi:hypothetical protein EOE18_12785 [Novosphingobium umbonatum]|uniref:Uncharacterized protein n=1 Tax=Novosphingobium umbonatum TaxID=1908524 RepID=A0A437N2B4_9SPHN|nr:hypothetical protein [Novosphingobium umbonatum]RVU04053.1 hypothetical protein EOE18_12785 [Novosphingobium umbonatum]